MQLKDNEFWRVLVYLDTRPTPLTFIAPRENKTVMDTLGSFHKLVTEGRKLVAQDKHEYILEPEHIERVTVSSITVGWVSENEDI